MRDDEIDAILARVKAEAPPLFDDVEDMAESLRDAYKQIEREHAISDKLFKKLKHLRPPPSQADEEAGAEPFNLNRRKKSEPKS